MNMVWNPNAFSTCKMCRKKGTDLNAIYCYFLIRCRRPTLLNYNKRSHKSGYKADEETENNRKGKISLV